MRVLCVTSSSWKEVRWESVEGWRKWGANFSCLRKRNGSLHIISGPVEREKSCWEVKRKNWWSCIL